MGSNETFAAAMNCATIIGIGIGSATIPAPAFARDAGSEPGGSQPGDPGAVSTDELAQLRAELAEARARIAEQDQRLARQQHRLDQFEQRLAVLAASSPQMPGETLAAGPAPGGEAPAIRVGEPPRDADRPPTVAVLDQQGSVVTRKGELVGEFGLDYTRADRNRAVFRGLGFIETVLVGVFDINESRQDIFTASAALRYGLADRLEVGVRVPFVHRSDKLVTAPIAGSTNNDVARTVDSSTNGSGIGDIEVAARYQLNRGGHNRPFLIANLQATIPTGRDPFSVRRDSYGSALQAATGAGFWGITPGITAILPSEPAVLFGTLGYTFNLARGVDTRIPPVQIDRVNPGDQINFAGGIGVALNDRTSMNFGYSHAWAFGTRTTVRQLDQPSGEPVGPQTRTTSRDLQIGRLLLGITHKFSERVQVNWSIEVGATQDAPGLRTTFRIPVRF